MDLNQLTAISPIDGRYRGKVEKLAEWFSEFGFLKLRVKVEVEWMIWILERIGQRAKGTGLGDLRKIWEEFSLEEAKWIKKKEQETKHDVKAIEYFIKERIGQRAKGIGNFIHFGLTSDDINNLAYGLALKEANEKLIVPAIEELAQILEKIAKENAGLVMLGRTHGQAAVPTTLGKEIKNFQVRVVRELRELRGFKFEGKVTGAVGNYNALNLAFPKVDWVKFSDQFILDLGLVPNHFTTQILPYDNWLEYFSKLKLLNYILIGFCQDVWRYISDDYLVQTSVRGEVGSSTMPQKINPIDFENAEGNLGIANSLIEFYERKLPISRLQRDLSDSPVKRTFGLTLAHSFLAIQNIVTGLGKISPNREKMSADLENHWEVISEGMQTVLRVEGVPNAYEKLKELTRGKKMSKEIIQEFIGGLKISPEAKKKLMNLTPEKYVGLAEELAGS